jgi:hypothetical protein
VAKTALECSAVKAEVTLTVKFLRQKHDAMPAPSRIGAFPQAMVASTSQGTTIIDRLAAKSAVLTVF